MAVEEAQRSVYDLVNSEHDGWVCNIPEEGGGWGSRPRTAPMFSFM